MARRYKKIRFSTSQILGILFLTIVSIVIFGLESTNIRDFDNIFAILVMLVLLAASIASFFLIRANLLDKARIKALRISDIDSMEGVEFEKYIQKVFEAKGYKTTLTSASNDFGVDLIAVKEGEKYAIQLKRYDKPVGRSAISDVGSGKDYYDCDSSMVITNSYFTKSAKEIALKLNCELIDRDKLSSMILEFQNH